jgi:hypothetical protein
VLVALIISVGYVQNARSKMVAAAPTSGYSRGCSDSQISNPADRYINRTGKGPSFHSKAFMQTYNEGFNACSGNSNIDSGVSQRHRSYWTPTNVTGSYHILLDGVDSTFKIGNTGLKVCIENGNGLFCNIF